MIDDPQHILPKTPVERFRRPFLHFMHIEASGGMVLLFCTAVALLLANSAWSEAYAAFWNMPIGINLGQATISHSLGHWINDGLMTIFFFVIGLEIKRELVSGELKDRRAAILPGMAALGGMIVPACIYAFMIGGGDGAKGWGIPMATDIAFVVGFLSLLGSRVTHGLKIFILSLAIVDDLGAIIIIATFYSSNISIGALGFGILGLGVIALLNKIGVRKISVYVCVGALIWWCFLMSGIHPTISGVLLGILTPASAWVGDRAFYDVLLAWLGKIKAQLAKGNLSAGQHREYVNGMIHTARETISPLERLELSLHPWVAFGIMPVFALANAGVLLNLESLKSPISVAVAAGLSLGKPIGIFLFSWIAIQFLGAKLPARVTWKSLFGAGCLAGVGFTMSIFIAGLALDQAHLADGKVGTLLGSTISTIVGLLILHLTLPAAPKATS